MIGDHLDHAVFGHEPVTGGEIDAGFPFFLADLFADRFVDLDRGCVHGLLLQWVVRGILRPACGGANRVFTVWNMGRWRSSLGVCAGTATGELAEHGAGGQAGTARVVVIEQPADHFPRGIQPGDRFAGGVLNIAFAVNFDTAEGEGHAAGDRISFKRRLVDGQGPVRLVDREPDGAAAVLDVGIELELSTFLFYF